MRVCQKLQSPKSSPFDNERKGNISVVHFLQNQETSSGYFSSSLYSEVEMSLHLRYRNYSCYKELPFGWCV